MKRNIGCSFAAILLMLTILATGCGTSKTAANTSRTKADVAQTQDSAQTSATEIAQEGASSDNADSENSNREELLSEERNPWINGEHTVNCAFFEDSDLTGAIVSTLMLGYGEYAQQVVFAAKEEVSELTFYTGVIEDFSNNGPVVFGKNEVIEHGTLSPGEFVVVQIDFVGDFPTNALSYYDAGGILHEMMIGQSGMDGSLYLEDCEMAESSDVSMGDYGEFPGQYQAEPGVTCNIWVQMTGCMVGPTFGTDAAPYGEAEYRDGKLFFDITDYDTELTYQGEVEKTEDGIRLTITTSDDPEVPAGSVFEMPAVE